MLNTAVESLGYHKDTLAEECPFEYHLFGVDPEDCSRFYSCIEGNIINSFRVKSQIFTSLRNPKTHAWCYFFFFFPGRLHHGYCGRDRYFDLTEKRCLTITPERSPEFYGKNICKLDAFDRIVDGGSSSKDQKSRVSSEPRKMLLLRQKGPRVVCYVTSWSLYRKEDGKFVPEHLDSQLCTDIVYAFAGLNPKTLLMQSYDPWADIENSELICLDA